MHSSNQFEKQRSGYDRKMNAIEIEIHKRFCHFHTQLNLEEDRIVRFVKEMHSNTLTDFDGMKQEFTNICSHRNYLEDSIQDNGSFLSGQYQECQTKLADMSAKSGISHVPELKWKITKLEVDEICKVYRNNIELTPTIAKAIDLDVNLVHYRKRTKSNPEITLDENYYINPISSIETSTRIPAYCSMNVFDDERQKPRSEVS